MDISALRKKVSAFEARSGFEKTSKKRLAEMMLEEAGILKRSISSKKAADHQLADILVLVMQIANRNKTDFRIELGKWFAKSSKYQKQK